VAAELKEEDGVEVETVRGGLGEFSIFIDDRKIFKTTRFRSPTPGGVLSEVRAALAEEG